jgi:hypothetical protein
VGIDRKPPSGFPGRSARIGALLAGEDGDSVLADWSILLEHRQGPDGFNFHDDE